jgi:hypothetical protein
MDKTGPRFEFRVFGQDLDTIEQRIRDRASCESTSESREIYLIDNEDRDHNVKIREGKLELKCLIERVSGLERWKPAGEWTFPLALDTIPDKLFPAASALYHISPFPASLSEKELLNHVAQGSVPLRRANLFKRRFRFTIQDCPAEIDQIRVNGAAIKSIAIESEHAEQVIALRSSLGLEAFENVAYPLAISRIMGIRPLPDEESYE